MSSDAFKAVVSHVIDPHNFWARIGTEETLQSFKEFETSLAAYCQSVRRDGRNHVDINTLLNGHLICVMYQELKQWRRAVIVGIHGGDPCEIDVLFIDYGTTDFVTVDDVIAEVPSEYCDLQQRSCQCQLAGIRPIATTWISRAIKFISDRLLSKTVDVEVLSVGTDAKLLMHVYILEKNKKVSLAKLMISEGLGMEDEPYPDDETQMDLSPEIEQSHMVPEFNLNSLQVKPAIERQVSNEQKSPDYEKQLFLKGIVAGTERYTECSDQLIGVVSPPIKNNVKSILDEIRQMQQASSQSSSDNESGPEVAPPRRHLSPSIMGPVRGRGNKGHSSREREKRPGSAVQSSSPHSSRSPAPRHQPVSQRQGSNSPLHKRKCHKHERCKSVPSAKLDSDHAESSDLTSSDSLVKGDRISITQDDNKKTLRPQDDSSTSDCSWRSGRSVTKATVKQIEHRQLNSEQEISKFSKVIRQIVSEVTDENLETKFRQMELLVSKEIPSYLEKTNESQLQSCVNILVNEAIRHSGRRSNQVIRLLKAFSGSDGFAISISQGLWKPQEIYLKVSSSERVRDRCRTYITFFANLYLAACSWEENYSIDVNAIQCLRKWAIFNMKQQNPQADLVDLYLNCLTDFLKIAGETFEQQSPAEMKEIIGTLRDRLLHYNLPRQSKEKTLNVLLLRERGWVEEGVSRSEPPVSQAVSQLDQAVQVQLEPQRNDATTNTEQVVEETPQAAIISSPQYKLVTEMLWKLGLDELLDIFKQNAIRDMVLDLDLDDVMTVLKQCGLLQGHLLQIRAYLKARQKPEGIVHQVMQREEPSPSAVFKIDQKPEELLLPCDRSPSSITLISPMAFAKVDRTVNSVPSALSTSSASGLSRGLQQQKITSQNSDLSNIPSSYHRGDSPLDSSITPSSISVGGKSLANSSDKTACIANDRGLTFQSSAISARLMSSDVPTSTSRLLSPSESVDITDPTPSLKVTNDNKDNQPNDFNSVSPCQAGNLSEHQAHADKCTKMHRKPRIKSVSYASAFDDIERTPENAASSSDLLALDNLSDRSQTEQSVLSEQISPPALSFSDVLRGCKAGTADHQAICTVTTNKLVKLAKSRMDQVEKTLNTTSDQQKRDARESGAATSKSPEHYMMKQEQRQKTDVTVSGVDAGFNTGTGPTVREAAPSEIALGLSENTSDLNTSHPPRLNSSGIKAMVQRILGKNNKGWTPDKDDEKDDRSKADPENDPVYDNRNVSLFSVSRLPPPPACQNNNLKSVYDGDLDQDEDSYLSSLSKSDWPDLKDPPPPANDEQYVADSPTLSESPPDEPAPAIVFGTHAPRACSVCGSQRHLVYNCPDKDAKFFL